MVFLCPDAADQDLDNAACWQIAARKLEQSQEQAKAIEKEEELSERMGSDDSTTRKHLLNTAKDFQAAVGKVASASFLASLEQAIQAEPQTTPATADSSQPKFTSEPAATAPKLVVPTQRGYANMWEQIGRASCRERV